MNALRNRSSLKLAVVLGLVLMLSLMALPSTTNAQVAAQASTNGFGAAFGYAQRIGSVTYTQAGSIGNGTAGAVAVAPGFSSAFSAVQSSGNAAALSTAIGSPFGSAVTVQAVSFFGGFATAIGGATP
jgi:hypothetical protein